MRKWQANGTPAVKEGWGVREALMNFKCSVSVRMSARRETWPRAGTGMRSGLEEKLESFEEEFLKHGKQIPSQMPDPSSPLGRV